MQREHLIERLDTVPFESEFGKFTLIAYRSVVDALPHVALVCGEIDPIHAQGVPTEIADPVLVRMHSQNLLGDVFGDLAQPSGRILQSSMQMIQQTGTGAVVYLRHSAMGSGLLKRLQTMHWPHEVAGTAEENILSANDHEKTNTTTATPHKRDYGIGSQILRDLGIRKLKLLTNHPIHPTALDGFGLEITEFVPVKI